MSAQKKVYLDYNATTPTDARVVEAMLPYFSEKFGNSSSDHVFGWDADEAVENSREQIANLVNCKPKELSFTSGATESANLALFGFCKANRSKGNHIISCKTEHKAVLDTLKALENEGFEVTYLNVDSEGSIDLEELKDSMTSETILVCMMLANNETGLVHPLNKIEKIVHDSDAKLMSDITQAVGKIPVDLEKLNLDLAVFSSHKIYGPKGVGALYINRKNKIEISAHVFGGGQEKALRPGTLNVPGIVGFGKAAEIAGTQMHSDVQNLEKLREHLEKLIKEIDGAQINAIHSERIPNTTNVSFRNIDGSSLLRKLNKIAVSRGSACSANTVEPSHVLKAMGLSDELALSSIRISLGIETTIEDVEFAAMEIAETVNSLKKQMV